MLVFWWLCCSPMSPLGVGTMVETSTGCPFKLNPAVLSKATFESAETRPCQMASPRYTYRTRLSHPFNQASLTTRLVGSEAFAFPFPLEILHLSRDSRELQTGGWDDARGDALR
ncbi:hypothetical protein BDB00DRAFT_791896 [Zychaea mexicana]|uniref:uncharacterized protein n=1 Tax=Zychaea mexicana TaxID=64656 RepID=UPI0022FE7A11|nr:uncharacterized protein BDB00DRAFT_791896 [Zychaea mexicana]KAI9488374.1 hypothetical protein BDB00DRAFT_791896 [Zychaea mexicana]